MILDPAVWVWILLACSVVTGLCKQKRVAYGLLAVALLGAFFEGRVSLSALLICSSVFGLSYLLPRTKPPLKFVNWIILIIWAAAMCLHLVPGINNLLVIDNAMSGPQSMPFSMYLNLDKPLVFFALLLAYPRLLGEGSSCLGLRSGLAIAVTTACTLMLLPIAAMAGVLSVELSWPEWWWLFALNNLLFTCVVEEALFRGVLQQSLSNRWGWKVGLIVASVLFGFAHFPGGVALVLFATLAGLGYGLAFHFSGRLWVAVLLHFLFNMTHLALYTYPALAV